MILLWYWTDSHNHKPHVSPCHPCWHPKSSLSQVPFIWWHEPSRQWQVLEQFSPKNFTLHSVKWNDFDKCLLFIIFAPRKAAFSLGLMWINILLNWWWIYFSKICIKQYNSRISIWLKIFWNKLSVDYCFEHFCCCCCKLFTFFTSKYV